MDTQKKTMIDLLECEVNALVSNFKTERDRHKRIALLLRILSVILAATITVLLGYKAESPGLENLFKNIALILSALITVVSAYEAFFVPRALWIRETVSYSHLKDLQRDIKLQRIESGTETSKEICALLKKRLDTILHDDLREWIKLRGSGEISSSSQETSDLSRNVTKESRSTLTD